MRGYVPSEVVPIRPYSIAPGVKARTEASVTRSEKQWETDRYSYAYTGEDLSAGKRGRGQCGTQRDDPYPGVPWPRLVDALVERVAGTAPLLSARVGVLVGRINLYRRGGGRPGREIADRLLAFAREWLTAEELIELGVPAEARA